MKYWNVGKRCLLRVSGGDALRFMNGQITQDAQLAVAQCHRVFATCVTDAKGRMQAFGGIFSLDGSAIYLEAPWELRDVLFARIDRYLIADDAEIEDVSEAFTLVHEVLAGDAESAFGGAMSVKHDRLGVAGVDHWLAADAALPDCGLSFAEAEGIRIAHGVASWGAELGEGILPPEAGLEAVAISYAKGCYIGQEVISRMKTAGKVNRKLVRLLVEDAGLDLAGTDLLVGDLVVGVITSQQGNRAMAWLKKAGFAAAEFRTAAGGSLRLAE